MTMEGDVFLEDDPRVAQQGILSPRNAGDFETACVWVSRSGGIFFERKYAVFHGCTHCKCECCGEIYEKHSFCGPCADRRAEERYAALPAQDWEEGQWICDGEDKYVRNYYEMADLFCDNENVLDRHWVIAGPSESKCDFVDLESLITDHATEEFEFSDEVNELANKLNSMIEKELSVVLWPTNTRVTFETFRTWLLEERDDAKL